MASSRVAPSCEARGCLRQSTDLPALLRNRRRDATIPGFKSGLRPSTVYQKSKGGTRDEVEFLAAGIRGRQRKHLSTTGPSNVVGPHHPDYRSLPSQAPARPFPLPPTRSAWGSGRAAVFARSRRTVLSALFTELLYRNPAPLLPSIRSRQSSALLPILRTALALVREPLCSLADDLGREVPAAYQYPSFPSPVLPRSLVRSRGLEPPHPFGYMLQACASANSATTSAISLLP
jgi:hypothetical protein